MFCGKCGAKVEEGTRFCTSCGAPVLESTTQKQAPPYNSSFDAVGQYAATPPPTRNADVMSAENLQQMFLSREGRLNRKPYFFAGIILGVIEGVVVEIPAESVGTLLSLVFLYPNYCLDVKRLHDIGNNEQLAIISTVILAILTLGEDSIEPSDMFFGLLAVVWFGIQLYMFFKEGTHGPNAYGPDPLEGKR